MAKSITVRELLIRVGVKADDSQLVTFDRRLETFKNRAGNAIGFLARLAAGAAVLGGALVAQAKSTAAAADTVSDMAEAMGITTDETQELLYVANQFNIQANEMQRAVTLVGKKMVEAGQGSKTAEQSFSALGISMEDLRGKSPAEMLEAVADRVKAAGGGIKQMAAASTIFGEELVMKLTPALMAGSEGIRSLRKEAHEFGNVMDAEAIASAGAFEHQWRKIRGTLDGVRNDIGLAVIPVLTRLAERFLDWVKASRDLIRERLEHVVRRVARGFELVVAAVVRADKAVQVIGGWEVVLWSIVAALTAIGTWKMSTATWAGFSLLGSVIGLVASALGVTFVGALLLVAAMLAAVVVQVGIIAAAVFGLYLVFEDLWITLKGGDSVLGRFIAKFAKSDGLLGSWARGLQAGIRLLRALYNGADEAANVVGVILAEAWGGAKEGAEELFDAVEPHISPLLDKLQGLLEWAEESVPLFALLRGHFSAMAGLLDRLANGAERFSEVFADVKGFGDLQNRVGLLAGQGGGSAVRGAAQMFAPTGANAAPGGSRTVNRSVSASTSVNVSGAGDPRAVAMEIARRQEELHRRLAASALAGGAM